MFPAVRHGMMAKQEPSPRQQQIADTVVERGSVAAAASALGVSCLNVDRALSGYHQRACARRIAELEAQIGRLADRGDGR